MEIIKLNLIPSGVNPTCHCSQYDEGRVIRIELFDGLTPYVLQSGDTVTLNVRKPDNTIVTASVTATQGNKYVDLVTTEQICACVGYNLCDLTITNGSTVIGTLNFIMQVERDVLADGIPSQSVIEDLDALVQEAVGDNYYTKDEVDDALDLKADKSTTYTKTQVDSALALKANSADVYTKTESDAALALKANSADVYTKTQTDDALNLLSDKINDNIENGFLNYISGYITPSGAFGASADYIVSDALPVKSGDMLLYSGKIAGSALTMAWGYSDKNYSDPVALSNAGTVNGFKILVVPNNVKYVRALSVKPSAISVPLLLLKGKNVLFYDSTMGSIRTFFEQYIINPQKYNRYKVFVLSGTYSFDNEFTQTEIDNSSFIGVTIPKWTKLIAFQGAGSVTFSLNLSSGHISTLNFSIGSGLVGVNVYGENCRYAIHDDYTVNNDYSIIELIDCVIKATNCSYGFAYGGGCRSNGQYYYKNCKFIGTTYEDGGYLMHSNTNFTLPAKLEFDNCEFVSQNGHTERACNIRGLGNNTIVNKAIFNNCKIEGMFLQKDTVFDWDIIGGGNSLGLYYTLADGCTINFADNPIVLSSVTPQWYNKLPIGSMAFYNNKPCWWSGSAWVDYNGSAIS